MESTFILVEQELQNFYKTHNINSKTQEKINYLLNYNVIGGKYIRMSIFLEVLDILSPGSSSKHLVLGWCIEILQAYFLVSDDIADNSLLRRGTECWYIKEGMRSMRDVNFMLSLIYFIIKNQYSNTKTYESIQNLFDLVTFKTLMGQSKDTLKKEVKNFEDVKRLYNMNDYIKITEAKTAYYKFYLPIKLAYICLETEEPTNLCNFCFKMGTFIQFQDDYLNFFPERSGKSGTDLEEKKITWYMCKIVEQTTTKEEIEEIMEYFNNSKQDKVYGRIQKLLSHYEEDEKCMYKTVQDMISESTKPIYEYCINLIYKRKK